LGIIIVTVLLVMGAGGLTTAIKLENRDSFCAACHTQPETSFYQRTQSTPLDMASAHSQNTMAVRCIDCHSGAGAAGRIFSLKQGAGDLAAYISGNYLNPAVTTKPLGDRACTKCHTQPDIDLTQANTSLVSKSASHFHFNAYINEWLVREPKPAGSCAACHPAHDLQADEANAYLVNRLVQENCEACHAALSGWIPPKPIE